MMEEMLRYPVQLALLMISAESLTLLPLCGLKNHPEVRPDFSKRCFCIGNACMMTAFCYLYGKLLTAPLEMQNAAPAPLYRSSLICFGLCCIQGVVFFRTLTVKLPLLLAEETLDRSWRYLLLVPFSLTLLFLYVSPRRAEVVMTGRVRVTTMLFLLMVPPLLWLLYHGAWYITVHTKESARIRAENDLLQMEGKRLRELREYMDETRALRHDFRQHLSVIGELHRTNQREALTAYLEQYARSTEGEHTVFSGNGTVDAIASHYDALAAAQETRVRWSLQLPEPLPVPETDFCAVFGNLVENALRAVKKLPQEQREVSVHSQMLSERMLGLSVKNPYSGEILLDKGGLPRSTRDGHGVGLHSVRSTTRKYHGTMDVTAENGQFAVMVMLNRTE